MNHLDRIFTPDPATFASAYFDHLSRVLQAIDTGEIQCFIQILLAARERGSTIFFIGNGGSAATASHFANDLAIGTLRSNGGKPFRAVSLTDNTAILTAIGNDHGYPELFVRQLRVLGQPGDVLVGISASGNSTNLLEAFAYARTRDIATVAITAFDGGRLRTLADAGIHVPTGLGEYGPAEDAHLILDHLIAAYLTRLPG
ncbi:MAG: SIS domain-containing protein [Magnetococcales bacterium]|nr:SIS domain-containing protein [Magnetococcales bacterium]